MKQNETKQKELYEAPAVLDINPVTINVAAGGVSGPNDPQDYEQGNSES